METWLVWQWKIKKWGREQGPSLLGDTADLSQELWLLPSLPKTLAASPSPGESVCLQLENACLSISAIYNFHVQKIFIIKICIMACNELPFHDVFRLYVHI